MLIKDFKFKSATGVCTITANAFVPDDNNVRGVLVMHHGMAEHNERYHGFFEYLTSNGIAVFMHDMANHGKSNQNADETGYFGDKDGYKGLIKDMKSVYDIAKKEYPDKKIVICGHSMQGALLRSMRKKISSVQFISVRAEQIQWPKWALQWLILLFRQRAQSINQSLLTNLPSALTAKAQRAEQVLTGLQKIRQLLMNI